MASGARRAGAAALAVVCAAVPATMLLFMGLYVADYRCDESCGSLGRAGRWQGNPEAWQWDGQLLGLALPAWIASIIMCGLLATGHLRAAVAAWAACLGLGVVWLFAFASTSFGYAAAHPALWMPAFAVLIGGFSALRLGGLAPSDGARGASGAALRGA